MFPFIHGVFGKAGLNYLLDDQFITTEADPLVTPRTAEPGPGSLIITNGSSNEVAIAGQKLTWARNGSPLSYDNGLTSQETYERTPGLAAYAKLQASTYDRMYPIGFSITTVGIPVTGFFIGGSPLLQILPKAGESFSTGTSLSTGVDYEFLSVLRSNGALHLIKGGSQYPDWTLVFVSMTGAELVNLTGRLSMYNSAMSLDAMKVLQLGGKWKNDFSVATSFTPLPVVDTVYSHEADCNLYVTWTPDGVDDFVFNFRGDGVTFDDTYQIVADSGAGTVKLYVISSGVPTELDAGQTHSFTVGTDYRFGIQADGGSIRTTIDNTLIHKVSGETTHAFNTDAKLEGVVASGLANLEVWPFVVTELEGVTI
jgi:hypothetical protein